MDELAEIGMRLEQLQEERRKSIDAKDWSMVTKLQERINELLRRLERVNNSAA
jgi:hypothetical protein